MQLEQDISIYNSKQEFQSDPSGAGAGLTPLLLNSQFDQQRQRFERLKFTYLEQETRDKFLRVLLNDERHDLSKMEAGLGPLKEKLKELENTILLKQTRVDETIDEVLNLHEKQEIKMSELDHLLEQVSSLETEVNQEGKKEFLELFDLVDEEVMNELNEENIVRYMEDENTNLVMYEDTSKENSQELEKKKMLLRQKQELAHQLEIELNDLAKMVASNDRESDKSEQENTKIGHWLVKMNKLLGKFTHFRLDSAIKDDLIVLNFGKFEIKLDKYTLQIIESNANIDITSYNLAEDKIHKLLNLISKLIM